MGTGEGQPPAPCRSAVADPPPGGRAPGRRPSPARTLPAIVALAAAGCAGTERGTGDAAAIARALQASLSSTRASVAAVGAASDGRGPGAVPPAAAPAGTPSPRAAPAPLRRDAAAAPPPAAPPPALPSSDAAPHRATADGPPPAEAAQLLGLPAESVVRRLGEPSLRRPEGAAEIWLYTARSCALDVILYREEAPPRGGAGDPVPAAAASGALRVAFAAARAAGTEPRSEAACLREIAGGGGSGAGRAAPAAGTASAPPAVARDRLALALGRGGS
ncbi:hypothetical protein [Caldovatus aquaticus]|uniref:Uncharacterized protein n=1 Tax=Caldovatus aquaticus TaxID=2865671 RepID=A0ABS7F635_9PROT|nr:hypothetical protein [Caldovatus aquaticus]MBW8270250.1 hypothetical protein [Caldovatus aquaticus]